MVIEDFISPEPKKVTYHSLVPNAQIDKWMQMEQQSKKLWIALHHLVWLHDCEQEGISSGMPTPDQWLDGVRKAREALEGA